MRKNIRPSKEVRTFVRRYGQIGEGNIICDNLFLVNINTFILLESFKIITIKIITT
jgi:hypothetical protein